LIRKRAKPRLCTVAKDATVRPGSLRSYGAKGGRLRMTILAGTIAVAFCIKA